VALLGFELRVSRLQGFHALPLEQRLQPFFALVISKTGSHFFCPAGLDQDPSFRLSAVAWMTGAEEHHHQLVLLRQGLMNSLPELAWNHNPRNLSLLNN
jgi:hypothetical protein